MWANKKCDEDGFYLFGGIDELNIIHNDLWLIKPNYETNSKLLQQDSNYNATPCLAVTIDRITNF
jgi:hypothetical protein